MCSNGCVGCGVGGGGALGHLHKIFPPLRCRIAHLVVVVVAVVALVVVMSDDKAGSWGWSIIHFLYVFCHKKSCVMDQWTNKASCIDLTENGVDV